MAKKEKKILTEKERFELFTKDLAKLSKKYGIALDVCGGVWIAEKQDEIVKIEYSTDYTSGDLSSTIYEYRTLKE
jgi:hypothetical protein